MTAFAPPLSVGIVCDYREEGWPSMDLVADMLLGTLRSEHGNEVLPIELRPRMRSRFGSVALLQGSVAARNADRLLGRFVDYPLWLRRQPSAPAVYHVVDHSYAHLVHGLGAHRTVVTCHDVDAFRSVLEPDVHRRGRAFRAMTRRILSGLVRAARITCDSRATRDEILAHGLVPPDRMDVVYLGVDPVMSPAPNSAADASIARLLGPPRGPESVDLLHVGSTIPRKRIDVLLRVFAMVREAFPGARLLRAGGAFTAAQADLLRELRVDPAAVVVLPFMDRAQLAAVYRRAALVVQPSDAEGFGLPVVEAMACGVPVVASDLPVLREVGGEAATYCPAGDVKTWSGTVCAMLGERRDAPDRWERRRRSALEEAGRFSWSGFADSMVEIYRRVAVDAAR